VSRLYTMAETAELLGISLTALYELRRKRHIAIVEIPGTGKPATGGGRA
jgi:hypothetical protein